MSKKKKRVALGESQDFSITPFASLEIDCVASNPEPEEKKSKIAHTNCRIRLEKKGRAGKKVTVIYGFEPILELTQMMELLGDLKKSLGSGGSVKEDTLEIQGDNRSQVAEFLQNKNYRPKGEF